MARAGNGRGTGPLPAARHRRVDPRALVALNHTLASPFARPPGILTGFGSALVQVPLVPAMVVRLASRSAVESRLTATGSTLDARGVELYARLLGSRRHVGAALAMMAGWDLTPLELGLPRLTLPVLLVAGERDPWFPPRTLERTAARLPDGRVTIVRGTGHLSHEERPDEVAERILDLVRRTEGHGWGQPR